MSENTDVLSQNKHLEKFNMPKGKKKSSTIRPIKPTGEKDLNNFIALLMNDWDENRAKVCSALANDVRSVSLYAEMVLKSDGYERVGKDNKHFDVVRDGIKYEVRCVGTNRKGGIKSLEFSPSASRGSGRTDKEKADKVTKTGEKPKTKKELYAEVKTTLGQKGGYMFFVFNETQLIQTGTVNYFLITVEELETEFEPFMNKGLQVAYTNFVKIWNRLRA